jgi:phosphoadenosine phosphosulfate reductase
MTDVAELGLHEAAEASTFLAGRRPQEILRWAVERFGAEVTMACSFGGPTGMVLLDMAATEKLDLSVFYLDTDFLFQETHQLIQMVKTRYGIAPIGYRSRWSIAQQEESFGVALWEMDPDLCCSLRKVEPNGRALEGKRAWIAGLRRDQSASRREVQIVEWDPKFELLKINPLIDWTEAQVWDYIAQNDVPYNALHEQGYPSIGCSNCTRAVKAGEDMRAGRWAAFDKTECGIHLPDQYETITLPFVTEQLR